MQRADMMMTDFFFFLTIMPFKKNLEGVSFTVGWLLMFHQDNHFLAGFRRLRKSHATKTKHTKQTYRVISNLLFNVSVFLNSAHKLHCWVELCLLFIFGKSVTIEIESLKKNHLSSLSLAFLSYAPLLSIPLLSFPVFLLPLLPPLSFNFPILPTGSYSQTFIQTWWGSFCVNLNEHWMNVGLGLGEGFFFHITLFTPFGKVPM